LYPGTIIRTNPDCISLKISLINWENMGGIGQNVDLITFVDTSDSVLEVNPGYYYPSGIMASVQLETPVNELILYLAQLVNVTQFGNSSFPFMSYWFKDYTLFPASGLFHMSFPYFENNSTVSIDTVVNFDEIIDRDSNMIVVAIILSVCFSICIILLVIGFVVLWKTSKNWQHEDRQTLLKRQS